MQKFVEVSHEELIAAPLSAVCSQFADLRHHITTNVHPKLRFEILSMSEYGARFVQEVKLLGIVQRDVFKREIASDRLSMMRLKSDLFDVLVHATDGTLDQVELQWDRRVALGVVMAAAGYPLNPRKGDVIKGIPPESADAVVFHAGTTLKDQDIVTSGGRVLCVTALGDSVKMAQQRAYEMLQPIHFDGAQYRQDIGHRAIKR